METRARKSIPRLLALLLAAALAAFAEDGARPEWTTLAPGLWYRAWVVTRSPEAAEVVGHVFRADPRLVRVTVLDARGPGRSVATAQVLRAESGSYLVVNGGFFDPENRPLGLLVGDGKTHSKLRRVDQGVFLIADGKPVIQHTRDALPEKLETAIQAGPRLIVDGRPLRLKPQASRRTSICLPGDGTVLIVVFPTAVSLADLAGHLAMHPSRGGLGCWEALNLDGGPSTQLSVATAEMSLEVEGGWPVPNGLAILPR